MIGTGLVCGTSASRAPRVTTISTSRRCCDLDHGARRTCASAGSARYPRAGPGRARHSALGRRRRRSGASRPRASGPRRSGSSAASPGSRRTPRDRSRPRARRRARERPLRARSWRRSPRRSIRRRLRPRPAISARGGSPSHLRRFHFSPSLPATPCPLRASHHRPHRSRRRADTSAGLRAALGPALRGPLRLLCRRSA